METNPERDFKVGEYVTRNDQPIEYIASIIKVEGNWVDILYTDGSVVSVLWHQIKYPSAIPTMHTSLIQAKDEHIARLEAALAQTEARVKELEAKITRLKNKLDFEQDYSEFLEGKK